MPLMNIVGITNIWTTFNVGFAFLPHGQQHAFEWVLRQLKDTYREDRVPKIFVTDRDLALMNAIHEVYGPEVRNVLCIWHINKDVTKNISQKSSK